MVTIGSQNDHCDTITIAEIPIAILLVLQAAIAMHCTNYWIHLFFFYSETAFLYKNQVSSHKYMAEKHYLMTVISQSAYQNSKIQKKYYIFHSMVSLFINTHVFLLFF